MTTASATDFQMRNRQSHCRVLSPPRTAAMAAAAATLLRHIADNRQCPQIMVRDRHGADLMLDNIRIVYLSRIMAMLIHSIICHRRALDGQLRRYIMKMRYRLTYLTALEHLRPMVRGLCQTRRQMMTFSWLLVAPISAWLTPSHNIRFKTNFWTSYWLPKKDIVSMLKKMP